MKNFLYLLLFFNSIAWSQNESGSYTFDPTKIKRDPFKPVYEQGSSTNLLTAFDVTRFQLVAILTGMGSPKAMVMLPNRDTEIVKVGDSFGKNNGKIQKISDSELVVRETYKDYQGNSRSHFTSLVIAD